MGRFFMPCVVPARAEAVGQGQVQHQGAGEAVWAFVPAPPWANRRPAPGSRHRSMVPGIDGRVQRQAVGALHGHARAGAVQPGVLVQVVIASRPGWMARSPIGRAYWMRATASFALQPQLSK